MNYYIIIYKGTKDRWTSDQEASIAKPFLHTLDDVREDIFSTVKHYRDFMAVEAVLSNDGVDHTGDMREFANDVYAATRYRDADSWQEALYA